MFYVNIASNSETEIPVLGNNLIISWADARLRDNTFLKYLKYRWTEAPWC